ncbi:hypothetical protein [Halovulum sp. GXIMD14793]
MKKISWILVGLMALGATSGCVPLAVGAGAAVVADTAAERDGDDGLF